VFFDIGPLELVALVILAILVFGPEKLPKVIQDTARFIRKVRQFSDNAKEDIRSELGPEFKDFEFEDLNPKNFARKHLLEGDNELGLKEITESFDLRKDLQDVTDAVNGSEGGVGTRTGLSRRDIAAATTPAVSMTKDASDERSKDDPPPFDADAT
jgi:sec-independent protein translocase protein TatB